MSEERDARTTSGWVVLTAELVLGAVAIACIFALAQLQHQQDSLEFKLLVGVEIVAWLGVSLLAPGFFIVEPNGSKVLLLFGDYRGTVKRSGFHWVNPFMSKRNVSLRARTLNGEKLKVNDLAGNPVEIAAVVVWSVTDTYKALFEVDRYEQYVATQSESAVRHLASSYPYDAE
ncbi:MAG: SPFH domain-containing protein, partial [Armatimonadota bacterium]|nr:SPFH domain-containing protein [Armatimonadota bacterium]